LITKSLTSASFLYLSLLVVVVAFLRSIPPKWRRKLGIPTASCVYLYLCSDLRGFVAVVLFVLLGYALLVLLARANSLQRANVAALTMLIGFACLKVPGIKDLLEFLVSGETTENIPVIGVSYILFRQLHLLVDQHQGDFAPPRFRSYFNYMLLFSSLLAGPIARYPMFERSWDEMEPAQHAGYHSWIRILRGFLLANLASLVFQPLGDLARQEVGGAEPSNPLAWFAIALYSYPMFLYLNFSGFTDIAIGSASLIGIQLPENFDHPFESRNVLEYWNRWHISLSHWIRDYVFMTGYKRFASVNPQWNMALGYLSLLASLLIMGLWHGFNRSYLVFGGLHGIAAISCQAYGDLIQRMFGRSRFKAYMRNGLTKLVAVIITFNFVSFASLIFQLGDEPTIRLVSQTWGHITQGAGIEAAVADPTAVVMCAAPGLLMAIIAVTGASAVVEQRLGQFTERWPIAMILLLTAGVSTLMTFGELLKTREPRLIYMEF
jgi:D-alanyl-lipoteichoic acid acyltransferase DltB (MBOAT superfamily)